LKYRALELTYCLNIYRGETDPVPKQKHQHKEEKTHRTSWRKKGEKKGEKKGKK
jgi:hypothetical protein